MRHSRKLDVIMYDYLRERDRSAYPRLQALEPEAFRSQVQCLARNYEMATLDSALAFLDGTYSPARDLCLLTFEDGFREHYSTAVPILREFRLQGVFLVITSCLEEERVAPVHMNQFLTAALDWSTYSREFLRQAEESGATIQPGHDGPSKMYPADTPEMARFKYFFHFQLNPQVRDRIVKNLFERCIDSERGFSKQLYLSWDEARQMQSEGMVIGGHSHGHAPLSALSRTSLNADLQSCFDLLRRNLNPQHEWPFSYPFGKSDCYTPLCVEELKRLGFSCAFSSERGSNSPRDEIYAIRRMDYNSMMPFGAQPEVLSFKASAT